MKITLAAFILFSIGGCAYLEKAQQSTAFKHFCAWAPVAVVGLTEAANEADNDPAKVRVAEAMREAIKYLSLVATQCPTPTP